MNQIRGNGKGNSLSGSTGPGGKPSGGALWQKGYSSLSFCQNSPKCGALKPFSGSKVIPHTTSITGGFSKSGKSTDILTSTDSDAIHPKLPENALMNNFISVGDKKPTFPAKFFRALQELREQGKIVCINGQGCHLGKNMITMVSMLSQMPLLTTFRSGRKLRWT
jgi:hypothetical protein